MNDPLSIFDLAVHADEQELADRYVDHENEDWYSSQIADDDYPHNAEYGYGNYGDYI